MSRCIRLCGMERCRTGVPLGDELNIKWHYLSCYAESIVLRTYIAALGDPILHVKIYLVRRNGEVWSLSDELNITLHDLSRYAESIV